MLGFETILARGSGDTDGSSWSARRETEPAGSVVAGPGAKRPWHIDGPGAGTPTEADTSPASAPQPGPGASSDAEASFETAETAAGTEETHRVAGEHFWHIAEHTLAAREGPDPDEDAVRAYMNRLVAANRDRLADPQNPDLLFPGQVVALPDAAPKYTASKPSGANP